MVRTANRFSESFTVGYSDQAQTVTLIVLDCWSTALKTKRRVLQLLTLSMCMPCSAIVCAGHKWPYIAGLLSAWASSYSTLEYRIT